MLLLWLGSLAGAQESPVRMPDPNVIVGAAAGRPALVSLRAEGWLADQLSVEVGFGLPGLDVDELAADLTLRLRPDLLCFGCGGRDLLTLGVGVAGVGTADRRIQDWRLAVGPDVAVTGVHWLNPKLGLQATVRGGAGPTFTGAGADAVDGWVFAGAGLSF